MKKIISVQRASQIILLLTGALIAFYLLVIAGIVPSEMAWINQTDEANVLPLTLIAIVFCLAFGLFIMIKMRYLKTGDNSPVVNIGMWIIAVFLLYNSGANVFSELVVDNFFFAPIELVLALLTIRMAVE